MFLSLLLSRTVQLAAAFVVFEWIACGAAAVVAAAEVETCQVFLVPGAFGGGGGGGSFFIDSNEYFFEYRDFFKNLGCKVKQGEFPADATIEERALVLRDQVNRFRGGGKVVLIAHSQGGLDARFALKTLGLQGVSALVTIGTPHRGTLLADWVVKQRDKGSILYWLLRGANYDLRMLRFAGELTGTFLKKHGPYFEAVSGTRYASARGLCKTSCYRPLKLLEWVVDMPSGDGMVPVESQQFGVDLGEFDLDHLSEVNSDSRKKDERSRLLSRISMFLGFSPRQ